MVKPFLDRNGNFHGFSCLPLAAFSLSVSPGRSVLFLLFHGRRTPESRLHHYGILSESEWWRQLRHLRFVGMGILQYVPEP